MHVFFASSGAKEGINKVLLDFPVGVVLCLVHCLTAFHFGDFGLLSFACLQQRVQHQPWWKLNLFMLSTHTHGSRVLGTGKLPPSS